MKNVKSIFGAMILGLILSTAALAGDVSTPGYVPPPPPESRTVLADPGQMAAPGEISTPGFVTELLMAALSVFYP